MNANKSLWWYVLLKGIFLIAAGLFFIFRPELAVKGVAFYIGLILISGGLVGAWNVHRLRKLTDMKQWSYLAPVIALIAGFILIFFQEFTLTVFSISIGIWVLIDGIEGISNAGETSKFSKKLGRWLILFGIISLILGMYILFNPLSLVIYMTIFFGVILTLAGAFMVVLSMNTR